MRTKRILAMALTLMLVSMASGTTTFTVNPGGGANYTSLSAAYAAVPDPLDDAYVINCAGATDDVITSTVTLNKVTSATNTLTITGDNTSGIFDDAKYQLKVGNTNITALVISSSYTTVRNLQVTGANSASYNYTGIEITGATVNVTVLDCIVKNFLKEGNNSGIAFSAGSGTGHLAYNNIIYNCRQGIRFPQGGQGEADNNTIANCTDYGLYIYRATSRTITVQNNLMKNNGTGDDYHVGGGTAGTLYTAKNYTSDANSPDSGCANATITFAGASDFHLDPTMAGTLLGVDLGATFNVDIDGQTRSHWDAGADELPVTSTESQPMNVGLNTGLEVGLE